MTWSWWVSWIQTVLEHKHAVLCLLPQLCSTLNNPMDSSPPGSSVLGDSSGKNTRRVAKPSSRESSKLRDQFPVSRLAGRSFIIWATSEAQEYWNSSLSFLQLVATTWTAACQVSLSLTISLSFSKSLPLILLKRNPYRCPLSSHIHVTLYLPRDNVTIVVVVQLLSHVWLFANLCTAECQAFLSFTISQSLLKLMSIESVDAIKPSCTITI